jgi:hypothetical protein
MAAIRYPAAINIGRMGSSSSSPAPSNLDLRPRLPNLRHRRLAKEQHHQRRRPELTSANRIIRPAREGFTSIRSNRHRHAQTLKNVIRPLRSI